MSNQREPGSEPGYRQPAVADGLAGEPLWVLPPGEAVVRVERRDNRRWRRAFYPEQRSVIIGRVATADLVIADPNIARQHCRVIFTDTSVLVEDLGSSGGIEMDGRLITCRSLHQGSRVWVGEYWLWVERRPADLALVACPRCARQIEAGTECAFCVRRVGTAGW